MIKIAFLYIIHVNNIKNHKIKCGGGGSDKSTDDDINGKFSF